MRIPLVTHNRPMEKSADEALTLFPRERHRSDSCDWLIHGHSSNNESETDSLDSWEKDKHVSVFNSIQLHDTQQEVAVTTQHKGSGPKQEIFTHKQ